MTYREAESYGILFGKSFQTIKDFFYQKQFGYFPPNTEYLQFETQVKQIGIEKFPFSYDEQERSVFKKKLEQKLQISTTDLQIYNKKIHAQRIRLDCVRNEPQSEPFVGRAR